jgi:hypothetical protein
MRKVEVRDPIEPAGNVRTVVRSPEEAPGCEVTFVTNYPLVVQALQGVPVPSLVALALDDRGIAARAVLPAVPGNGQHATVGRHDRAEVSLSADEGLSLRHLLIVSDPIGERLTYRVLDLRSTLGMRDEWGRQLAGFEADGPAMVEVGRYVLLFVPRLHGALGWSTDALVAWRGLSHAPLREVRRAARPVHDPDRTEIEVLQGVSLPEDLPHEVADALPVGILELESSTGTMRRVVGRTAARSGVLLGRDERCEAGGSAVLDQPVLSRIHAVLLQVGGLMTVVDLGSVNGTWIGGKRVTMRSLASGDEVHLGRQGLTVRWLNP